MQSGMTLMKILETIKQRRLPGRSHKKEQTNDKVGQGVILPMKAISLLLTLLRMSYAALETKLHLQNMSEICYLHYLSKRILT
jgi:hypothetical protein